MPKENKNSNIHLNLLNPQSNPEKIYVKTMRWVLTTGRYILIVVELVVFVAFLSRFKFDADLAANTEAIDQKIPFIESFKPEENLIRQTQKQLSIIKTVKTQSPDYTAILSAIAAQTPQRIVIDSLNMSKEEGKIVLKISGNAQNNNDLSFFVRNLKGDPNFSEISLTNVGLEEGTITFSIGGNALLTKNNGNI